MPNDIVIWDAVDKTGTFLNSVTNFSTSVGTLISHYKSTRQINKVAIQKSEIYAKQAIQAMQDEADYQTISHRMELIQKAIAQATSAPDTLSKNLCMEYVAQLHNKFKRDFL